MNKVAEINLRIVELAREVEKIQEECRHVNIYRCRRKDTETDLWWTTTYCRDCLTDWDVTGIVQYK